MQLYEQVTSIVQELQNKFPMPSESKLRSICREVLQDQIIIKSIFSTTVWYWQSSKGSRVSKSPALAAVQVLFVTVSAARGRVNLSCYWSFIWKTLLGPRPKLHHDLHVFCLCVICQFTCVNHWITHVKWWFTLVKYLIPGLQLFFS